jgi:hypothetical protein
MKAVQHQKDSGFVEILLRATVYDHLRGVLKRYTICEETADDSTWLETFLADLERRDAEDIGTN